MIDTVYLRQEYFENVLKVGSANRPHVTQALILQLCSVWKNNPLLTVPFFPYFCKVLVYREPILDDHNRVDGDLDDIDNRKILTETIFTVTESSRVLGIDKFRDRQIARVLLLEFLEANQRNDDVAFIHCVHELIEELISMNTKDVFKAPAMIGTELFGEKLRCWQALCILSTYVTEPIWRNISDDCFDILTFPCAHGIRVHIEIFFAAMGAKFPHIIIPQLLNLLLVFNHSPQVFKIVLLISYCHYYLNYVQFQGAEFLFCDLWSFNP